MATTRKTPDGAGMARAGRAWRRRPRAAARQALRLYEAELHRLAWDTAGKPPTGDGQPRSRGSRRERHCVPSGCRRIPLPRSGAGCT
jgi:hypothetical protein